MPNEIEDESPQDEAAEDQANGAPPDASSQNVVTLPFDMLPPGIQVKDGDKLTFCVQGQPDDSGVMGYFEPAPPAEDDWDSGLRQEMSPRNPPTDDDQPQ